MKKPSKMSQLTIRQKESMKALVFFIPLIVGMITFFLIPVFKSFLFSISDVTSGSGGYQIDIKDFSAYYRAMNEHTDYKKTVASAIINTVTTTPLIILFSFFMASVLNQNFKGKTFFRTVLFLPLALTIMETLTITLENSMGAYSSYKSEGTAAVSFTTQISQFLLQSSLAEEAVDFLVSLVDSIYGIVDESSIQILVMLIGMQSVSPALYEAATVEGATAWESFWKITFPMVSPMILVCIIYTIIDSFTNQGSGVMSLMETEAYTNLDFSLSSAMGWIYFLLIAVLLVVVAGLFKLLFKHYDV